MMKKQGVFLYLNTYSVIGNSILKSTSKQQPSQHHKNEDVAKQPKRQGIKRMKPADSVIMLHCKVSQTSVPIQRQTSMQANTRINRKPEAGMRRTVGEKLAKCSKSKT